MLRSFRIVLVAAGMLGVLAPTSRSFAQKRIAVLDIEDAPNALLRKDIVKAIGSEHKVISAKTFKRTATRLGAETMTSENLARVAAAVKADGVLSGSVTESRGRYVLRLHLRSGRTGKTVQKLRLRLGRARLSKRMRGQLRKQLLVAIRQLRAVDESGAPSNEDFGSEEEIEVVAGPKAKPGDDKPKDKQPKDRSNDKPNDVAVENNDEVDDDDDSDSSTEEEVEPNPKKTRVATAADTTIRRSQPTRRRGARDPRPKLREARRAASVMLGASVVMRDLAFTLAEPFPEAPNGYDGPMAPGLNVQGEFYPLQLTGLADSLLASLGFAFRFDRVLGLQTAIDAGGQPLLAATDQSSYNVGVRIRYRFSSVPSQPTITLGAGLGKLSFTVDDANLPAGLALDVPNTSYSFLDPGMSLRLAIHPRVHVSAGGRLLLITNAGDVQEIDQYGAATITSYAVDTGLEFLATPNWRVRAIGSYTTVAMQFIGNGEQTYLRDGDPGDVDVLGANDRYLGGVVSVGYVY